MSKKTHDHKQLRALEKHRRIDRVSHKDEPGLSIRVPKLCRESLLYDLSRDFYRLTGVDIFIGIPATIYKTDHRQRRSMWLLGRKLSWLVPRCLNYMLSALMRH